MWLWQNVVDQYVQPAELIDRMLDRYLHCIPRNAGRHCPPSGSISLGNISIDQRDGDSLRASKAILEPIRTGFGVSRQGHAACD